MKPAKSKARKSLPKTKKITDAAYKRLYDVPGGAKLRYHGLKGIYWWYFSRYVRYRDFKAFRACVSCGGRVEDWKMEDAGHFVAASHGGFGLLFDERNVNLQHKHCNNPVWTPDAAGGYAIMLDYRYGTGTAATLWNRRFQVTPEWSQLEYEDHIAGVRKMLENLAKH